MIKYSIVFQSQTGNTALLAEQINKVLPAAECIYTGAPDIKATEADLIFVGFWTDKGTCSGEITGFLESLHDKMVFLFGTAGFGGSEEYFGKILTRVEENLDSSNTLTGSFMSQGKMQMAVRRRYEGMASSDPEKVQALLDNFDSALSHPDMRDIELLRQTVKEVWQKVTAL